jgi:hypothetical protein
VRTRTSTGGISPVCLSRNVALGAVCETNVGEEENLGTQPRLASAKLSGRDVSRLLRCSSD